MQEPPAAATRSRTLLVLAACLGIGSYSIFLAYHNVADADLWAKLMLGAFFWSHGQLIHQDPLAFTPVLPEYIDHEWGSGVIFFGVLQSAGPSGLLLLKILLAIGALMFAMVTGRRNGCSWEILLLLSIPSAFALMPGYVPVIRSHSFTYFFFGLTLLCLEEIRKGRGMPAWVLPLTVLLWVNLHGGFIAGLGIISLFAVITVFQRKHWRLMIGVCVACWSVTLINPYGAHFWKIILPALLHPRTQISEWGPTPWLGMDSLVGFRILFVLVAVAIAAGWSGVREKSVTGLVFMALTGYLAWSRRRHAPFFAITALAYAGPYFVAVAERVVNDWKVGRRLQIPGRVVVVAVFGLLALWSSSVYLPRTTFDVLAPVGLYPVREVDILSRAGAKGNLAVPFSWGSYASWRLYPGVKVSMDGRYEATYPESTFDLNYDFFYKRGPRWDRLIREHVVDFVILDLREDRIQPEDLAGRGYERVWSDGKYSALYCLGKHAAVLKETARTLPPVTPDPLVANISRQWQ